MEFAHQHLSPFTIKDDKILPEHCPLCHGGRMGDKNTFLLNMRTGGWVCKRGNCGQHGSFNQLAQQMNSPLRIMQSTYTQSSKQYVLPDIELLPLTQTILDYFNTRGISPETLKEFSISADDKSNIVFPFYEDEVLTYVKYRKPLLPSPKPKEWQVPNTRPILFGMQHCSPTLPLVICEGQIDCLSLIEAGLTNVVSVPCGCESMDWVENCWDFLEEYNDIVLFGDNDAPGQRMIETLIRRLGEHRCKKVSSYPCRPDGKPCKDANDILKNCGPITLLEMVDAAQAVPTKGLIDLASVHPIDPTTIPRISTNIQKLDECLGGLAEGAITVFTGKAGDGKSTIGGLLLLNAIEQGHKVCAYSGELSKEEFQNWIHFQAAGSEYITLKYDPIKKKLVPSVPPNVTQRIMQWYAGNFFLFDNNEIFQANQSESILQVFSTAANRYGCKLFLVDNLMTSLSDSEEETRAQGKFVAALKRFALRYRAHVIIVAHARKTKAGERLGQDDISGNSAIIKLAHNGVVIRRPDLEIIKSRDSGMKRLIRCCYAPDSRRIYQADIGDKNTFSWDRSSISPVMERADAIPEYQATMSIEEPF